MTDTAPECCSCDKIKDTLPATANSLLTCRGFLWDILMDGAYTGCYRKILTELKLKYGSEAVFKAFEEA